MSSPSGPPRVAVVTGAAGGIGGAVAAALAAEGTTVVGFDRSDEVFPDGITPVVGDLTDAGAVAAMFERVADLVGDVDLLVNCAGASGRAVGDGPVHEIPDDGWRWTLAVNLDTTFHTCRAAVPMMLRQGGGAIVNVSSVLGMGGDPHFATHAYAAAKGAVIALSRSMAVTYAPDHIRVNVVCPGLIATGMTARAAADPAITARLSELQPLTGAMGTPEDVAGAVCYLASPAARFVTGTVLTVDGGWTAR